MYVEYCNYNKYIEDYEKELKNVFHAIDQDIRGLALPIHMIREIREYIPQGIVLASPIDYPLGYSSSKVRYHMVLDAIKSGANAIDYMPNHYYLRAKFRELKQEINAVSIMCKEHGANLRLFMDYKYGSIESMAKTYAKMDIDLVFCTTGYHHDDFNDNLINCKLIEQKTRLSTIFNGYIWTPEQLETVKNSGIFGIRLYNPYLWCK